MALDGAVGLQEEHVDRSRAGAAVVDMVYGPSTTKLAREARRQDLRLVDGKTILFYQALRQFRAMTGQDLNQQAARAVLGL